MRAVPEYADALIVSNISNAILRPLPFSRSGRHLCSAATFSNVRPAAALAAAGRAPATRRPRRKASLKLGTQQLQSDEVAEGDRRPRGQPHLQRPCRPASLDEHWSVEGLTRLRERVESHGIRLEMVPLPLSSAYITRSENPNIMLGKSPERDREIDDICQMIRNAARAGIPALKYNMTILGVVRTEPTPGRGGARYSTFVYDQAKQEPPLTEAGPVSAEAAWERITYFLKRVIPVAEEYKVRMACHPHDPGMPRGQGFRGVHRVLGSVDGLKRFIEISAQPVPRPELLPGHRLGDAAGPGAGDLRRHPLLRHARARSSTSTSATSAGGS